MFTAKIAAAALALGLAVPLALAAPASAKGDEVIKRGSCSGSANWELQAKHDEGRMQVEGEVDANHNGQTWRWQIRHNGSVSARGSATTAGRSGSFSVERRVVDLSGTDRIVFRAVRPATGQVCRGVVQ